MTTVAAHSARGTTTRPWRLGGRTRKAVLLTHIAAAGVWVGLDVVMAILVFTGLATDDQETAAVCFRVLELVTVWPMTVAGLLCLGTGVLLGLGSKYGLIRYWWVAVKLFLNLLLVTLVLVALRPSVGIVAEHGRALDAGAPTEPLSSDIVFPPIVSPTLLLVAMTLSVFKPWGRLRGRSRG